ncbi:MAG TPA: cysteine desulfurase, partial [Ruminococcaceae bacterium]|nr:cysteine desulfurase [Oscillospiraceae bacterium]
LGHHCAQPLLHHLGLRACCRASVAVYNTREDVDMLAASLQKVRAWLGYGT